MVETRPDAKTSFVDEEDRWNAEAAKVQAKYEDQYAHMHMIWEHPRTGAKLWLGNSTSSSSRELLVQHDIRLIVNTTRELKNHFEDDPRFEYLRWVVSDTMSMRSIDAVEQFVLPTLQKIDNALENGDNVLSHCLAGAHRSAVTICLYLYWKVKRDVSWAYNLCESRRPVSQPSLYGEVMKLVKQWVDARYPTHQT